nr:MAG TPA: hypothetical protein [Bacteriophage sp.]
MTLNIHESKSSVWSLSRTSIRVASLILTLMIVFKVALSLYL